MLRSGSEKEVSLEKEENITENQIVWIQQRIPKRNKRNLITGLIGTT
jgi:hypothetical protein